MIEHVSSADDDRLNPFRWRERQLASRHDRREKVGAGLFVAEGDLVVERALAAGCHPVAMLCDERTGSDLAMRLRDEIPVYVSTDDIRKDVTGLGVPLRATGLFRRPPLRDPDDLISCSHRVVIMEAVDNPTNLGAVVRSAAALGWDALIIDATSADPLARRALRVSMGTGLYLPFARLDADDSVAALLQRHALWSVALSLADDSSPLPEIVPPDGPRAILLGSERDGLDPTTVASASERVRIPMHSGVDSLNVGAAAAIALYQLR